MERLDQILDMVSHAPSLPLEGPQNLRRRAKRLSESSRFELVEIGKSSAGSPMEALHWPGKGKAVAAWGYPHPDEPLGALALSMLCEMLKEGQAPEWVSEIDWWIVLCADPDQAELNTWVEKAGLDSYLEQSWRPIYSSLEVDYHFPISSPPFYQPRDWSPPGTKAALPESCALADMINKAKPDLVCLMHSNHVSGCYDYFLSRPTGEELEAIDRACEALATPRHLGERPDPGKRWKTRRPDILKEVSLGSRLKNSERKFGDLSGKTLVGCASASQFSESINSSCQVLTPEVGLWQPDSIDSTETTKETRQVEVRRFETSGSWREGIYGMHPQIQAEVCYQTDPASGPAKPRQEGMGLTRGMAGVEAVEARRFFLSRSDIIFQEVLPLLEGQDSPFLRERLKLSVSGEIVNDRSMLIFRSDPAYRRQATEAEAQDLQLRWGMQSCLLVANPLRIYRHHNLSEASEKQSALLEEAKKTLLQSLPEMTDPPQAARSQLARVLILASQ